LWISALRGQVSERQNPDQVLIAIDNQDPTDLARLHQPFGCFCVFVLIAMNDLMGHDIANPRGKWVTAPGDASNGDVTISEHAHDLVPLADRQWADPHLFHFESSLLERVVWPDTLDVLCHDVFDFHGETPVHDRMQAIFSGAKDQSV
jgi:hypothetical protein